MDYAKKFALFCFFTQEIIHLALTCHFDDETLKSLFWIGANYHHPMESIASRTRTSPDPEPGSSPTPRTESFHQPQTRLPDTEFMRTEVTLPPCSASPPVPLLPDVRHPAPSPGTSCDVEPQVVRPSTTPKHEDPVASPSTVDLFAPSRPVDLPAPSRLLTPMVPPETLRLTAPPVSLDRPAPPWSVVPPLPSRTCRLFVPLCPSTPTDTGGSSFPSGRQATSVFCRTGVTSAFWVSNSTYVDRRRDVAGVSVCTPGSTCRVSVGCPPDAVSLPYTISVPNSSTLLWTV
ncbi:hypothetical protein DPX16_21918 [Anabarilius grahami]|uniref:Uncharacterized protein n=1 Tax=Anabarilius grahami TaxID=495550 RepID=A0A3N0XN87_ANAGA|nr:hypothetical protein DPX16_21918 [Anabarilius grahami]